MTYKFTENGIERPFVPERDMFRLLKYETYDLLELASLFPEEIDPDELTEEELLLVEDWYEWVTETFPHTLTIQEAFGG